MSEINFIRGVDGEAAGGETVIAIVAGGLALPFEIEDYENKVLREDGVEREEGGVAFSLEPDSCCSSNTRCGSITGKIR